MQLGDFIYIYIYIPPYDSSNPQAAILYQPVAQAQPSLEGSSQDSHLQQHSAAVVQSSSGWRIWKSGHIRISYPYDCNYPYSPYISHEYLGCIHKFGQVGMDHGKPLCSAGGWYLTASLKTGICWEMPIASNCAKHFTATCSKCVQHIRSYKT